MQLSELLTYSTVLITCKLPEPNKYCTGTGFIMNLCIHNSQCIPVIITNKHVIENSVSCEFTFCKRNSDNTPNNNEHITCQGGNANEWFMHPNADIDLCCLPIGALINNSVHDGKPLIYYTALDTSLLPSQDDINNFSALEDVIMIGYPKGLSDNYNNKPILRKGITATHIKNDYQGRKEFLIDMACFPGSSGSPVFILNEGAYSSGNSIIMGSRIKFVGILYAGPQFTANGEIKFSEIPSIPRIVTDIPMNLGCVIKSSEILAFEPMLEQLM